MILKQPGRDVGSAERNARRRPAAFTMIEVALCLAIIGFALVSILAVLPLGMNHQQETRQATVISQDATMWLEAIRGGAHGPDDLTNYIIAITNYFQGYNDQGKRVGSLHSAGYTFGVGAVDRVRIPGLNLTNGQRIIGVMSTPEFTKSATATDGSLGGEAIANTFGVSYTSNRVYAYVRSFSGMAVEKPPQGNEILRGNSFSYRMVCVNAPAAAFTNVLVDPSAVFDQQFGGNLRELRLMFQWPLLPSFGVPRTRDPQNFRTDIAGRLTSMNDAGMPLYFYQSQSFTNTP